MLSFEDIIGVCECTEDEIMVVLIHEHVPDTVAAEIAEYLMQTPDGINKIRQFIHDDIDYVRSLGMRDRTAYLKQVLRDFEALYPSKRH